MKSIVCNMNLQKPILLGVVDNPPDLWNAIDSIELDRSNLTKSSTNILRKEVPNKRLRNFLSRCFISWKILKIEKSLGKSSYIQNNTYPKILISNAETILSVIGGSFRVPPNVIVCIYSRNWCVSNSTLSRTTITGFR